MADADETKQQEPQEQQEQQEQQEPQDQQQEQQQDQQKDVKPEASDKKFSVARFLPQIIIAVIVVLFAGAGFTLGRLFAGSSTPQTLGASEQDQSSQSENLKAKGSEDDSQKSWYYHLEPVIANLDVADVTRYVKAWLTLEISSGLDEKKGKIFLDEKKPILTNSLTVYLASLGLDDIRGDMNLKRIQSQILDDFNEKLFPGSKSQIKRILFKEFAVQ